MQPIFPRLPNLPISNNYSKVMFVNQLTACHLVLKVMRAKNILKSNYGKTSEIVRAYIDNINSSGCGNWMQL